MIVAKTEVTKQLEQAIWSETRKQGTFGCYEVTIGWFGSERVDYMTYNTKGEWRCYEIKCSVSDFHSKAKKTFIGHYNYFVMTQELYDKVKDEIPDHIGVYIYGRLVKRPKRQELGEDEQVIKDSFIRSLYRDTEKFYEGGNDSLVLRLKNKISGLESKINTEHREVVDYRNRYSELRSALRLKFGHEWKKEIGIDEE